MDLEYLYIGEISTKSDIYSLGILIIIITTGEKIINLDDTLSRQLKLLDNVRLHIMLSRLNNQFRSLWCIQFVNYH
jgi:serine/threonine protein kinase